MKTICFPIEIYQREIDSRLLLAIKVASRGAKAIVGRRNNQVFRQVSGATFFMSPGHANTSLKLVQKFEQSQNTICFHDEEGFIRQSDQIYLEQRVGQTVRQHGKINFTWNKFQDELLRSIQVSSTCITGSPKFDLPLMMKRPLPKNFRININTRFAVANPAGEIGLEGVLELARLNGDFTDLDRKRLIDSYEKDTVVYSEFLDLIERIGQDGSLPTAIRVHPAESQKRYREIAEKYSNIEVENGVPLFDSINHTSVVVHDGCTTAFDAKLMDRHVVALRPESVDTYYNDLANNFSDVCCTSAGEVFELLSNVRKTQDLNRSIPLRKTMLGELIPNSNGTFASDIIANILMQQSCEEPSQRVIPRMTNQASRFMRNLLKTAKRKIRSMSVDKDVSGRQVISSYFGSKYPVELDMEDLKVRFEKIRANESPSKERLHDVQLMRVNNEVIQIVPVRVS
jgi:surface carbohydrate biosynthesis protein